MRAQIDIAFQFNPNSNIALRDYENTNQANVSKIYFMVNETGSFRGFRGFHFAGTRDQWPAVANGNYLYYPDSGYKGYVSSTLSDAAGNTNVAVSFYIQGDIPDRMFITFDSVCNEYATSMTISNNQNSNVINVSNRRYITEINLQPLNLVQNDNVLLTISVKQWNKPFKNVKITTVSFNYTGIYTENDIIEFECSENLFDKQLKIEAGICEQYADIQIYDRSQLLHEFAMQEVLANEQKVTITIIDDANDTSYILGTFYVNSWDVKSNSSVVGLNCKDIMLTLDKLNIQAAEVVTRNVHDMLSLVFSALKNTSWKYIDSDTENYCKSITTPNSWFYTDTLMQTLIKICLLGQIRIYWYVDSFIVARCY